MQTLITTDYRKWLFSLAKANSPERIFKLYKALENVFENEWYQCQSVATADGSTQYHVICKGVDEILILPDLETKLAFLQYLKSNYFPVQDIESWYKQNTIKQKLQPQANPPERKGDLINRLGSFTPHRKETRYYNIKVIVSLLFYAIVAIVYADMLLRDISLAYTILGIVPFILFFGISTFILKGLILGELKGRAIKADEEQFPEVYQLVKEQADYLELKSLPEIYITSGHFNAWVMRMARANFLVLHSEVIETCFQSDRDDVLRFVIAHELGHIKRKHLSSRLWLIPSLFIPFLGVAYSRGCEYSCDRIGYTFSPKGAVDGILIMSVGKDIYTKVNAEKVVRDQANKPSFWMWLTEKFGTHPHPVNRLKAIKHYDSLIH